MEEFRRSRLWTRALDDQYLLEVNDRFEQDAVRRLQSSYLSLRHRASTLANEIARDVPTLTVHDISHLDALWETADIIVGDELLSASVPYLNPLETYVLGCAFLVHDLAQSRAALSMTDAELSKDERFGDLLSTCSSDEDNESVIFQHALEVYLRENHAELSLGLLNRSWQDLDGKEQFLLVDAELRQALARPVGQIAASHGLPVGLLNSSCNVRLGAPVFLPQAWSCDMIKLAALIRLADASHIDARRAPAFLAALRKPGGISKDHWLFQQRLYRVRREGDRLVYTSGVTFPSQEIEAWWLCYDTLQMIDRELKEVDALLADIRKPRFAARMVAGIDEPKRLAELVPTEGWVPIDTQIRVGNVAALVTRLGGGQLYGDNLSAPLRELIQNACDAVQARRLLEDRSPDWGQVVVELEEKDGSWWLRVSDSGIGMSSTVLTGALLDFGTSFWNSSEARKEFPGLRKRRFQSTGRFGIGFFSCFMLGSRVKITSRRYDLGASETKVLEFQNGPSSRPILRPASVQEARLDGTKVEIELTNKPLERGGLLFHGVRRQKKTLNEFCAWLCPGLPVTLKTRQQGGVLKTAVTASDWESLDAYDLLRRIEIEEEEEDQVRDQESRKNTAKLLAPITNAEGAVLGRLAFSLSGAGRYNHYENGACIVVGGCRSEFIRNVAGIVSGVAKTAARNAAKPLYTMDDLKRWAVDQAERVCLDSELSDEEKASCASQLLLLEVPLKSLPWIETADGWYTEEELKKLFTESSEVIMAPDWYVSTRVRKDIILERNIILAPGHAPPSILGDGPNDEHMWVRGPNKVGLWTRIQWRVIEILAVTWNTTLDDLFASAQLSMNKDVQSAIIGVDKYKNPVETDYVHIFRR